MAVTVTVNGVRMLDAIEELLPIELTPGKGNTDFGLGVSREEVAGFPYPKPPAVEGYTV